MLFADAETFVRGNQAEAGAWILIGLVFAYFAYREQGEKRTRCLIATAAFLLFGLSDLVEIRTGAWWRPWWLLAWKAMCVAAMLGLLADDILRKRRGDGVKR